MLTFQISCKYLWGYNNIIDPTKFKDIQSIIDHLLKNYRQFLKEYNLQDLVDLLDLKAKKFHIHGVTYDQLINMDVPFIPSPPNTIYVCCHDDCTN